jgi:hypothetical protein
MQKQWRRPAKMNNVTIRNATVGIEVSGRATLELNNVHFENVETPISIGDLASVSARGTRIANDPKGRKSGNQVGWRKLEGPPLPSFCPNCKTIFPSRNYIFAGAYFNSWDNEDVCVECGFGHAKLIEGIFSIAAEAIAIISAPDFSHVLLQSLERIAVDALAPKADPSKILKRIGEVHPKLQALANRAKQYGVSAVTFLAAVAGIASTIFAYQQVQLQLEANKSSDVALERTLSALAALRFTTNGVKQIKAEQRAARPSNRKVKKVVSATRPALEANRKSQQAHSARRATKPKRE